MNIFIITENGKKYRVAVRGAYQHTIRNEKKLREVVTKSMIARYGIEKPLFESCSLLGILTYSAPLEK